MTFGFDANLTPATFAVAMYNWKQRLVTAGAVVKASSDGTTYNSTGDQISSGNSGAGGFDNASAWMRIQLGDGAHEITIQRNSSTGANTSRSVRFKYSKSAKFTGGSPGATQTPSATDEQILIGGGTDAAPTFTQWMSASDNTYSQNIGADAASPYGYFIFYVVTGSAFTTLGGNIVFEPINPSTPTTDPDPYVIYWSLNADNAGTNFNFTASTGGQTYLNNDAATLPHIAGYIGATFTTTIPVNLYATQSAGGTYHASAIGTGGTLYQSADPNATSKDLALPLCFARSTFLSSPNGFKGFSANLKYFVFQAGARSQLALESIVSTGDYAAVGPNGAAATAPIIVPWNNTAITG